MFLKEAHYELTKDGEGENMQHDEDKFEENFHEPMPLPPGDDVDRELQKIVEELLNIPHDDCVEFFTQAAREVQNGFEELER